jgi:hypothetical protein
MNIVKKKGSNWATYLENNYTLRILSSFVTVIRVLFITGLGSYPVKVKKIINYWFCHVCLNIRHDAENIFK